MVRRDRRSHRSRVSQYPIRHQRGFPEGAGRLEVGAALLQAGGEMKIMPIQRHLLWSAAACIGIAGFLTSQPAAAQSLIDGYWNPLLHQDAYPYAGGPDPGDFSGLPITEAARKVAQQYDPDEQTMPELQCRPFP